MKRFHVHLSVGNLADSIRFYSALFGTPPSVDKPDYAKWMLDDPRINFAISTQAGKPGIDHLGLEVESEEELTALRHQFGRADLPIFDEGQTTCCYAVSNKHWTTDPQGVAWETYQSLQSAPTYHGRRDDASACCASTSKAVPPAIGAPSAPRATCCG